MICSKNNENNFHGLKKWETQCSNRYQGESNQGDAYTEKDPAGIPMPSYGCRFPAMISDWRTKWSAGSMGETAEDFPFGFVNLAPWINPNNAPAGIRWAQSAGYGERFVR